MTSLIAALNASKTSIETSQTTIDVIGNNISNMNTEGYSDQTVQLEPVPTLTYGSFFIGQGVKVQDIARNHDDFITNQLQNKSISLGYANGQTDPLSQLEGVFNVTNDNISTNIDNFFDAWKQLSTNPSDLTLRSAVLQQGNLLAKSFNDAANNLNTITGNINTTLTSKISTLNSKISQIADLNEQIYTTEINGQTNNSARDQRELLAKDLAQSLGATTFYDNKGMLNVQLPGGLPLVQGTSAMSLQTTTTGSNVQLQLNAAGTIRNLDVNTVGGEIQGMLAIRDQTIPQAESDLNTLATEISTQVNTLQAAGGTLDTANPTGVDFFSDPTASTDPARNMTVTITDPNQVAAGAVNPGPPVTIAAAGDNTNALAISDLGTDYLIGGTDTFDSYYANTTARIGLAASQNSLAVTSAQDAVNQLQNLRDSVAGVSLENEMVNMIQYQQTYQASAKYLSTVDTMMNYLVSSYNG